MPTYKVYKNGAEVDMLEGANEEGLVALLERAKVAWIWQWIGWVKDFTLTPRAEDRVKDRVSTHTQNIRVTK